MQKRIITGGKNIYYYKYLKYKNKYLALKKYIQTGGSEEEDSDDDEPRWIDVTDETEEQRIERERREEREERAERERRRWEIPKISAPNHTNLSLDDLLEQERKFLKEKKGIVIDRENHNWMRGNRISQEFSNWLNLHDYIVSPSVELYVIPQIQPWGEGEPLNLNELLELERKFLNDEYGSVIEPENHNWTRGNQISYEFFNWLVRRPNRYRISYDVGIITSGP